MKQQFDLRRYDTPVCPASKLRLAHHHRKNALKAENKNGEAYRMIGPPWFIRRLSGTESE